MKTNYRITLAATIAAALTIISQANAQYKPTGDDGITASPKVRAQLNERKTRLNATTTSTTASSMACARCKDVLVSVPAKGLTGGQVLAARGTPTKTMVRHLCASCDTTISVAGTGKAKHTVATHTCGSQTLACFTPDKSKAATKITDSKPVETKPLK